MSPPSQPNIILVLTDDQTLDIGHMPYLSSRTDWTSFTNAFENVSLCCPSRASILTGQYDTHHGVMNNTGSANGQALDESNTLPVWLKSAGYTTGLVGKYLNGYPFQRGPYIPPGWDTWDTFIYNAAYSRTSCGRTPRQFSTDPHPRTTRPTSSPGSPTSSSPAPASRSSSTTPRIPRTHRSPPHQRTCGPSRRYR